MSVLIGNVAAVMLVLGLILISVREIVHSHQKGGCGGCAGCSGKCSGCSRCRKMQPPLRNH